MTKRESGFLLLGLAFGLLLAVAAIVEVLRSLYRRAFITSYSLDKVILVVPVLLLVIGLILILQKPKGERPSN